MNVFELAQAERKRQVEKGYTPEHDDEHIEGEMAAAAGEYATAAYDLINGFEPTPEGTAPLYWPASWDACHWKPGQDPKRCIIKAIALLAAEYDRIERQEQEEE